jgi:hypothetical protein
MFSAFYIEFYFCRTIPNSCLLIVSNHIGLILAELLAFGLSISVAGTVLYLQRGTKAKNRMLECCLMHVCLPGRRAQSKKLLETPGLRYNHAKMTFIMNR